MEKNLKIRSTVLPEERITYEQWKKEFHLGERLNYQKPNLSFAPLEIFIKSINNQFEKTGLQTI